jgi:hypothetical protein
VIGRHVGGASGHVFDASGHVIGHAGEQTRRRAHLIVDLRVRSLLTSRGKALDHWRSGDHDLNEDMWTRIVDRMLGCRVSGHPDDSAVRSPTALFVGAFYLSPMAGSSSLSWPFALT